MSLYDLKLFFPEITILIFSIFILMYGIFSKENYKFNQNIYRLSLFCLLISFYYCLNFINPGNNFIFNNLIEISNFSTFIRSLVVFLSIILCVLSYNYLVNQEILKPEYFFLLLLSTFGVMVMICSNNFLSMYLGLEIHSICLYILASYKKDFLKSSESGVKFFILGALSSGILLYGFSLVYAHTNTTDFFEISDKLKGFSKDSENFLLVSTGFVMILSGLFFKCAAVPFHMWAPDTFEGSPTPITAFFSTIPKIGTIAILIKILNIPFESLNDIWFQILYIISIISMVFGAIAAVNQNNIKRLLAYSSINHIGFILLGVLTATQLGLKSVNFYLLVYSINVLGIFACLLCIKSANNNDYLEDINLFSGLIRKNTFLSCCFAVLLFSLAGLPPLSGFFSKLYILFSVIDSELYIIAIIAVITSVIAAFYYIKIIKIIFFDKPLNAISCEVPIQFKLIIFFSTIFSLTLIFFAKEVLEFLDKTLLFV